MQITEAQHRRLTRSIGRCLGVSLTEAVRRCGDGQLAQGGTLPSRDERIRAALAVFGKYGDSRGETRVAPEHDRYLDEAHRT